MRFKQIVIKAIEMFAMLTVSGLYHSTDCVINSISMNAFKSNVRYNGIIL